MRLVYFSVKQTLFLSLFAMLQSLTILNAGYETPFNYVEQRQKWLGAVKLFTNKPSDKVCYLHFQESDFWGMRLKRCIVVPSKNLPEKYYYEDGTSLVGPMPALEKFQNGNPSSDHSYSVQNSSNKVITELMNEVAHLRNQVSKDSRKKCQLKRENADLRRKVGTYRSKYKNILSGKSLPKKTQNSVASSKLLNSTYNFSKTQISMILSEKERKQGRDWSKEDFRFAGKMIQLKGKTVTVLNKEKILPSPSLNCFQKKFSWINSFPGEPIGPVVEYFRLRKYRINTDPCILKCVF
jgi:hypothetical protein